MTQAALFIGGLVLIVGAAELFTNAVEWTGFQLELASGATGSLLAALGTSLPETVVPIVALVSGSAGASSVASGAVLGSPFLLLGLGVAITGVAVVARRRDRTIRLDTGQVRRDLGVFLGAYSVVLLCMVLPRPARIVIGVALLATYAGYVVATLRGGSPAEEMPEPLHMLRRRPGEPPVAVVVLQLLVSIALLVVGSDMFVSALNDTAAALHTDPLILALIVVPVATELPETFNSVLWVRSGDDTLAFGNVAGSAAFQACVLGFVGITFTSWRPGFGGILSSLLTLGVAAALLVLLRHGSARGRWLMLAGVPWVAYVVAEVVAGGRLGG